MSRNVMKDARKNKNDEFYTRYEDIEREVMRYKDQFVGKTVLCNCDDPEWSNFWRFFHRNFSFFQLKKLISTHYVDEGSSYVQIYDGTRDNVKPLTRDERINNNEQMSLFDICNIESNGDFRSPECIKYLEEADIVVTNPPFSLFREFIVKITEYNKKFLILGNMNAITYKETFSLIKENKLWIGYGFNASLIFKAPYDNTNEGNRKFVKANGLNPDDGYVKVPAIAWFTNLDTTKRHEDIILYKEYNKEEYPRYINFNGINVDKVSEIPCNYYGYMGVPITFLGQYNPEQFEIIKFRKGDDDKDLIIKEKSLYFRILIRRKYDNEGRLVRDFYDEDGNFIK